MLQNQKLDPYPSMINLSVTYYGKDVDTLYITNKNKEP